MRNKVGEAAKRVIEEREAKARMNKKKVHYEPYFPQMVRGMILRGWDQKAIANCFCVAESTISEWKKKYPEFRRAIDEGKDMLVAKAVGVGWEMATGGYLQGKTVLTYDAKTGRFVEKLVQDTLPPSPVLLKHFLENMAPESFKAKQEVDLNVEGVDFTLKVVDQV